MFVCCCLLLFLFVVCTAAYTISVGVAIDCRWIQFRITKVKSTSSVVCISRVCVNDCFCFSAQASQSSQALNIELSSKALFSPRTMTNRVCSHWQGGGSAHRPWVRTQRERGARDSQRGECVDGSDVVECCWLCCSCCKWWALSHNSHCTVFVVCCSCFLVFVSLCFVSFILECGRNQQRKEKQRNANKYGWCL